MLLTASILIRALAAAWSVVMWRRIRDARMFFLTAMLLLMALRQLLSLIARAQKIGWGQAVANIDGAEIPGLVVSGLAAASVVFLARMFLDARDSAVILRQRDAELAEAHKLEVVGRLAGGVAHDFNNQLSVVLANLDVARRHAAPEAREALDNIAGASAAAAQLTRQLVTFARREVLEPQVFELRECVNRLQPMIRSILPKTVSLSVDAKQETWPVEADPSGIEQVILNLLLNAREATEAEGSVRIGVGNVVVTPEAAASLSGATPGEYAALWVEDTGKGIPEEVRSQIFEPFFTTKGSSGTGLGLAVCHGTVHRLGGHFVVESKIGQGTRIEVRLPRTHKPRAKEPAPQTEVREAPAEPTRHRVLLVDDEPRLRTVLAALLTANGYLVTAPENSSEAAELPDSELAAIDLLLTDAAMPVVSGVELARRLRARRPELRVVFMSGYSAEHVAGLAPTAELLQKPFEESELVARITAAIGAGEAGSGTKKD